MTINGNMKQLLVLLFLISMGCFPKHDKSKNPLVERDELIQISLSTNGRKQDTTGAFAIELNKDFSVNYYGGSQSDLAGNYVGKIEQDDWNRVLKLIDSKQIKDTILSESSFEDNYFDLSIKFQGKKYFVSGFYSHAPQDIKEICELVLSTMKKTNFTKMSERHLFEVEAYKVKEKPDDTINFVVPEVK